MLTITSPRNSATRVEVLGGALVLFDAGVARVDGALNARVERAAKKRGYRIALERTAAPAPVAEPGPPTVLAPAALPPVPPAPAP